MQPLARAPTRSRPEPLAHCSLSSNVREEEIFMIKEKKNGQDSWKSGPKPTPANGIGSELHAGGEQLFLVLLWLMVMLQGV